jgi:hypothetical protein
LVFGFFKKPNLGCSYPRTKGAEDFTRAKLFLDFSENNFEMSIKEKYVNIPK